MTVSRLDLRRPPAVMAAVAILVLLAAIVLVVVWFRLEAIRPSADCLREWFVSDAQGGCAASVRSWQARRYDLLSRYLPIVPFLAGLALGAVAGSSARSYESALSGAWRGWAAQRLLPAAALLVGSLAAFAAAATLFEAARTPVLDALGSYGGYDNKGVSAITRGLAAFSVTTLASVLIRRRIIALAISVLLAWLVVWGTEQAFPYGAATEWMTEEETADGYLHGIATVDVAWRDADGTVIPYLAVRDLAPDAGWYDWAEMHFWQVEAVLRGDQFIEVQAREAILLGSMAFLVLSATVSVAARRRAARAI